MCCVIHGLVEKEHCLTKSYIPYGSGSKSTMKIPETVGLISFGSLIAVENFLVILAAIRNKSLRESTHYNLDISLSMCEFDVGLSDFVW